jgi:hypothetical protein
MIERIAILGDAPDLLPNLLRQWILNYGMPEVVYLDEGNRQNIANLRHINMWVLPFTEVPIAYDYERDGDQAINVAVRRALRSVDGLVVHTEGGAHIVTQWTLYHASQLRTRAFVGSRAHSFEWWPAVSYDSRIYPHPRGG